MDSNILQNRIRAIRRGLDKAKINCLIVTKAANVTYTTGFLGDDSWTVITPRDVYLLTDSRYTEQAQKECPACRIIERSEPIAEAAAKLIKGLKSVRTAYVEKNASVETFEALKKHLKRRIKTVRNIIENVRRVKGNDEAAAIRTAGRIAAKALKAAIKYAVAGISENELAGRLDFEIRRLGAVNSFETIVAFGANASRPHHQPGKRKLKNKDAVLIDFGAKYKSYCCDITRCFTVGRANRFYQKVYKAVEEAQSAAIKKIKAGVSKLTVDAAAREVIAGYDLPVYGHGTGHGLGLEIHEEPFVTNKSKGKLKAGEVITIEPGIYIPGKLGVRIEDDVLVTNSGCRILSRICPHSPMTERC